MATTSKTKTSAKTSKPKTGTILRSSSGASYNTATGQRTPATSRSNSNALAQKAVDAGYVKSVAEYNNSVTAGQLGAKYGYSKTGSSYTANNSKGKPITSQDLQNTPLIDIPTPPPVKNEMSTIIGANASVVNPAMGITAGQNGGLEYTTPQTQATAVQTPAQNNFQSYLNSVAGLQNEAPSAEKTYNKLYRDSGLKNIDRQISDYTSQINNITAKAQAESLGLEGQGRGITESIIGGQQAQISREAAIQALPLQALLANAQGNKELAQTHLDTMYKLQMQDAQNKYDYKLKLVDAVYNFASSQEKARLDEIARKEDRDFELKKGDIAFERQKYMEQIGFANSKALKQMDIEQKAKESVVDNSSLLGLLGQYKAELKDSNAFTARFSPTKVANLASIKGQITAEYKKAEKLGTLDAGVQKLIDTIIPPAGGFGLVSLSPSAQVSAIDNFITNQGGTVLSSEDEDEIDNIASGTKGFNPVNYYK